MNTSPSAAASRMVEVLVCCELAVDSSHQHYLCGACTSRSIYGQCGAVCQCQDCGCYYHFGCLKSGSKQCSNCGQEGAVHPSFFVHQINPEWVTVFEARRPENQRPAAAALAATENKDNNNSRAPQAEASNGDSSETKTDATMSNDLNKRLHLDEEEEEEEEEEQQQQSVATIDTVAAVAVSQPQQARKIRAGKTVLAHKPARTNPDHHVGNNNHYMRGAAVKRDVDYFSKDYPMQQEPKHKSPKVQIDDSVNNRNQQYHQTDQSDQHLPTTDTEGRSRPLAAATSTNDIRRRSDSPPVRHSLSEEKMEVDESDDDDNIICRKSPDVEKSPSPLGTSAFAKDFYVSSPEVIPNSRSRRNPQRTYRKKENHLVDLCSIDFSKPAIILMDDTEDFDPSSTGRADYPYPTCSFELPRGAASDYVVAKVVGPDPRKGRIPLQMIQIQELEDQGQLVSGDVTTAYLGLLSNSSLLVDKESTTKQHPSHRKFVFKATSDFAWTSLKRSMKEMGNDWKKGWTALAQKRGRRRPHCNLVDDREAITTLQLFEGSADSGHFACLVIDRRVLPAGIFTFFDSGKRFGVTSMSKFRKCFEESGCAANEQSIWIDADVPQQGSKTMDCGVWMCMFIASFLRTLKQRKDWNLPGGLQVYRNVTTRVTPNLVREKASWFEVDGHVSAKMVGWFGRAHVRESLFKGAIHENPRALSMLHCEIE